MSANATVDAPAKTAPPCVASPATSPTVSLTAQSTTLSFDEVYEEHFSFVWRSVRRLGTPDAQVDDAVQEAFLVVYRRLKDFEGRSSLRSWLYGIVANVVKDCHRTARRKDPRMRGEGPDVETLVDPRGKSPQESLEHADAVRLLHELLDQLDWEKREAFVLLELEQMSAPEVAAALGINSNTVYSRIRAARQAFDKAVTRHRAEQQRRAK